MAPSRLGQRTVPVAPFQDSQLVVDIDRQQSLQIRVEKLNLAGRMYAPARNPIRQAILTNHRFRYFVNRYGNAKTHTAPRNTIFLVYRTLRNYWPDRCITASEAMSHHFAMQTVRSAH